MDPVTFSKITKALFVLVFLVTDINGLSMLETPRTRELSVRIGEEAVLSCHRFGNYRCEFECLDGRGPDSTLVVRWPDNPAAEKSQMGYTVVLTRDGTCDLIIHSVQQKDLKQWSCRLYYSNSEPPQNQKIQLIETGPDACTAPFSSPPCPASFEMSTKYYFDPLAKACVPFNYGGCGGNGNRFDSGHDCWKTCGSKLPVVENFDAEDGNEILYREDHDKGMLYVPPVTVTTSKPAFLFQQRPSYAIPAFEESEELYQPPAPTTLVTPGNQRAEIERRIISNLAPTPKQVELPGKMQINEEEEERAVRLHRRVETLISDLEMLHAHQKHMLSRQLEMIQTEFSLKTFVLSSLGALLNETSKI